MVPVRIENRAQLIYLLTEAAEQLAEEADVLILAQASMAHLAPVLNQRNRVPVLASPDLCVEALGRYLDD